MKDRFLLACVVACAMAVTLACGEKTPTSPTGTPANPTQLTPGGGGSGTGQLRVYMKDKPGGTLTAAIVTIGEVSVHRSDGLNWEKLPFTVGTSRTCNLLKLTGGVEDFLGVGNLPAGHYTQIRLKIDKAIVYTEGTAPALICSEDATQFVMVPGETTPTPLDLKVPSDYLKLNHEFTLEGGGTTSLVLDFDAGKSFHQTGNGDWMMQPVISVSMK